MESKKRKKQFVNREVSWMNFNHRVLQEAANTNVPLIERIRFLGIYSNNLDEFYRVRVAMLNRFIRFNDISSLYLDNPAKILAQINQLAANYQCQFEELYAELLQGLEQKKIRLIDENGLNEEQAHFIRNFYRSRLVNSLNPIILNNKLKFPELTDASIYLMIDLQGKVNKSKDYALLEIPTNDFSRFVVLPDSGNYKYIILLDDVIRFCLPDLFSSLSYQNFTAYTIKFTRDAEMDLEQELSGSLPDKISRGIKKRKRGNPVRLVYDRALPKAMIKFIASKLGFDIYDTIAPGGRYHNFKDFMHFPDLGRTDLIYEAWPPAHIPAIDESKSMLNLIKIRDIGMHYPYQSFSYFIRMLREAAIDPDVKAIKITMYRLANDSRIVRALINAAANGKKVTAVVELLARFDESANIDWARRMQDAGIKVVFGVEGLKIHCKLVHISRKGGDIVCVSTGNFHEGNARVYTDLAVMTANHRITAEVNTVFEFIDQPYQNLRFNHLLVSPQQMRKKIYALLRREIAFAKAGQPAYLLCKINHVSDKELITRLYEAAQAGVKIKMVVRGNCSMLQSVSDNIEIVSIVDRYLEHSRVFIFGNGGTEICYISSADWMTRNLDHRIEVAMPVYDQDILKHFKTIIEYGLKDNVNARIIDGSGDNRFKPLAPRGRKFRSQLQLYRYYRKN